MKTKELTLSAIVLAIIIVLGFVPGVPLGFIPVPIALQNVGIMLAGVILGRKWGFLTVALFLLLALAGLPIVRGNGGAAFFIGPTAGYLFGYAIGAFLIGWSADWLREHQQFKFWTILVPLLVFGMMLIDAFGAIGLSIVTHMPLDKALIAQLAFFPGDATKAVIAAFVGTVLQARKLTV